MRLIDVDALKLADFQDFSNTDVFCAIDEQPTIDPVHVAGACYCKECKYRFTDNCSTYYESSQGQFQHIIEDEGYCSYGERREQHETD